MMHGRKNIKLHETVLNDVGNSRRIPGSKG